MGTKHELAASVKEVILSCQPGRVLDAFAGMGAVAESLAGCRPVWTNDVQHYAYLASSCRFADEGSPPALRLLRRMTSILFRENRSLLREQNATALRLTRKAIAAEDYSTFERAFLSAASTPVQTQFAYGCFSRLYSHGYFSLEQCIEIDSIRYALEVARGRGELSSKQFNWALVALGRALLRVANTTGHFAQFLTPSLHNYQRVIKQFRRSVWREWLESVRLLEPVGTPQWRSENMATRADSMTLLQDPRYRACASVVYCDPPYTDDQYSRFYHVWETLVLYDYPEVSGKGRYRPGRFTTEFSLSAKVENAFRQLVESVSTTGADLVLSYPSNGLLHQIGRAPLDIILESYPSAETATAIAFSHSTMGASKGAAKADVIELIYVGRAKAA